MHVEYRIHLSRQDGCVTRPASLFPCLVYVPAGERALTYFGTEGDISWMACQADDLLAGPWPKIVKGKAGGDIQYNCFHFGYDQNGAVTQDDDVGPLFFEASRFIRHAQDEARKVARLQENERRYERNKRGINRLKEQRDARRERSRRQRERLEERRQERQRETCTETVIDGVRYSCGMN